MRRWCGWRLLAVDGSTARRPNSADVLAAFGAPRTGPRGRFSRWYDVLDKVGVDADFCACDVGERGLAGERWAATETHDLIGQDPRLPGLSARGVRQDVYAKRFARNLTAIGAWVAQAVAERLDRRRADRVNFAHALSKRKDSVVR